MSVLNKILKEIIPAVLLLAIIVIIFREVAFFIRPLKWDALDCTFPWKYFISTCFSDGVFPFWNPYQHLGYPFYGDAQSTLYYPGTLLMTWLHGYTIKMQAFDYLFHVWAGALGMYYLGRHLKFNEVLAFILALAYAFSGFMVGNAQHIYWIVSAAWLPYVVLFYMRMQSERKIWQVLVLSFFLYLMISGGYPAFVIVLAYIFTIIFIIRGIRLLVRKKHAEFWRYSLLHVVLFLVTAGMSMLYLVSVFDNYDFSSRAGGLSLAQALYDPFSVKSFVSFILPLLTTKGMAVLDTDMSMANGYIGLFVFMFFIISLFGKKNKMQRIVLVISFLCLVIAAGEKAYLREFLYHYLPMFNSFRFPSAFRLFSMLGFILSAGYYLQNQMQKNESGRMLKHILFVSIPFILIFVFIIADNFSSRPDSFFAFFNQIRLGDFSLGTESLAFFQSSLALALVLLFLILIFVIRTTSARMLLILCFTLLDLAVVTRFQAPYSVYSPDLTVKELNEFADQHFVKSYPVPDMSTDVIHHSDSSSVHGPGLWRNLNNFYGQFAHGGFSSYINKNIDLMEDSLINVYRAALNHKPLYVSTCVKMNNELNYADSIQPCDYADEIPIGHSGTQDFEIVSYSPNRIEFNVYTTEPSLICYLQSWHKYWRVYINGAETHTRLVNYFHLGVISNSGHNNIVFEFRPRYFSWVLFISLGSLLLGLGFFILFRVKNK